jgi:hypothetical protein
LSQLEHQSCFMMNSRTANSYHWQGSHCFSHSARVLQQTWVCSCLYFVLTYILS